MFGGQRFGAVPFAGNAGRRRRVTPTPARRYFGSGTVSKALIDLFRRKSFSGRSIGDSRGEATFTPILWLDGTSRGESQVRVLFMPINSGIQARSVGGSTTHSEWQRVRPFTVTMSSDSRAEAMLESPTDPDMTIEELTTYLL